MWAGFELRLRRLKARLHPPWAWRVDASNTRLLNMPDEEVQERGREGVGMVKTWLESTTWMTFPANAYEDGSRCKVLTLGKAKKFDLRGEHLGDRSNRRRMSVECKRYRSKGGQLREYRRFLAIAYSAHARGRHDYGSDWAEDFLWVTTNPFETDKWSSLRTAPYMLEVLSDSEHEDILGPDHHVDEELAREVVERIWLLVFDDDKQLSVTLTIEELKHVMTVLERGGTPLWRH